MLPDKTMHMLAQAIKSFMGKSHHSFRWLKDFPRRKLPRKWLGIDPWYDPGLSKTADLHGLIMISTVDQIKAPALSIIFRGMFFG